MKEYTKQDVIELYIDQKKTYREIRDITGFCNAKISKYIKGLKSLSQSRIEGVLSGRWKLSEKGREALSENGRKAMKRSLKFGTKPEIQFLQLLRDLGLGVQIPLMIQDVLGLKSDINGNIMYQYPIQRYIVDFAIPDKKIVLCVNGDYWHANPLLYGDKVLGKLQKVNVRQDANKKVFLEKAGWLVVTIWESEIYWNKELVIERVKWAIGETVSRHLYTLNSGVQLPHCPPNDDWSDVLKSLWFKTPKEIIYIEKICKFCGKKFTVTNCYIRRLYCCRDCFSKASRKVDRPTEIQLRDEMESNTWVALGKKYGVSDRAVKKWAKAYGII